MPSTSQLKTSIFANLTNIRSDSSFGNNLYYFIDVRFVITTYTRVEQNQETGRGLILWNYIF